MKINSISASSFSTYDWCEWKWFLRYCAKFDDPAGPSAMIGHIVHKAMEIISLAKVHENNLEHTELVKECSELCHDFDYSKIWDYKYLIKKCEDFYQKENPEVYNQIVTKSNYKTKYQKILKGVDWLFDSVHSPLTNETIGSETSFELEMSGPQWITSIKEDGSLEQFTIRGKIDRIDKVNDKCLEIIDYKTGQRTKWPPQDGGSKEKTIDDFYDDVQCLMYFYAVKQLYPNIESVNVTFIFFLDQTPITVSLGQNSIDKLKNKLLDRFMAIKNNNDPQKNKGFWCKYICTYGKTGVCDKVWKEKENFGIDFVEDYNKAINYTERN